MPAAERIHATAIAIGEVGVLLRGPSGSGKSDLALRLVLGGPHAAAAGRNILLVADDQVLIEARGGRLFAHAPDILAGRIEARGLEILDVPSRAEAELFLLVDLVSRMSVERMPEEGASAALAGLALPRIALHAFDASAPLKVILALDRAQRQAGRA